MLANVDELSDKLDVMTFAIEQNLNQALVTLAPLLVSAAQGAAGFAKELKEFSELVQNFRSNPSLENLVKLLGVKIREGSIADQIRDMFDASSNIEDLKAQIAGLEEQIVNLQKRAAAGEDVQLNIDEATKFLDKLKAQLASVGDVAVAAAQEANKALASIGADPRAAGFAFQSKRASEVAANAQAVDDFLAERLTEAGQSQAEKEFIERTQEVIEAAQKRGVVITEEAAKVAAAKELEAEKIAQADDKVSKSSDGVTKSTDRQSDAYGQAGAASDEFARKQEELAQKQEEVADAFKDGFKGFLSDLAHGASLTDALTNALDRLADRLIDIGLNGIFDNLGLGGSGGLNIGGRGSSFQPNTTFSQFLGAGSGSIITGGGGNNTLTGLSRSVATGTSKGYRDAIASIESAGSYSALGPILKSGDRAYGRYQVMGNNIGPWTQEALGTRLSPQQFLNNPQAQDQVFDHVFGGYVKKYGESGAANAWFTGSPTAMGKDALGTSNTVYVEKFNAALQETTAGAAQAGQSLGGVGSAGLAATKGLGDAASGLSSFGSMLSSFMSSSMGGGSGWFQGLMSMFGGAGGAFGFMNSISPAATASIIGAGGGFTGLFASGGYTGNGGVNDPAGIVHGREFVMNAGATRRHRRLLEAMNAGAPGYALGAFGDRMRGSVKPAGAAQGGSANVTMNIETPDVQSFMKSRNQIAARTGYAIQYAVRTQ
jgi:hypothetical protein